MTEMNAPRLATCQANLDTEYPTCVRCGAAWHRAAPPPPCNPMNFDRLRQALLNEAAALEGSHNSIVAMLRDNDRVPADPVASLQRATALRAVLLVIDRCSESQVIKNELRRIVRDLERAAAEERAEKGARK